MAFIQGFCISSLLRGNHKASGEQSFSEGRDGFGAAFGIYMAGDQGCLVLGSWFEVCFGTDKELEAPGFVSVPSYSSAPLACDPLSLRCSGCMS